MKVLNVIVHVIDKNSGNLILSHQENNSEDSTLMDYLKKTLKKLFNSEYKVESLSNFQLFQDFSERKITFKEISKKMAIDFFEAVEKVEKIPGGDLMFFYVENDDLNKIFGMVKLDYNTKYSQITEYQDDVLQNRIIKNQAILPSPSQIINDAFFIVGDEVRIREKKYANNGDYWSMSHNFFKLPDKKKPSENLKVIEETAVETSQKYGDDFLAVSSAQEAVYDSLKLNETVDNTFVADELFQENETAKQEFLTSLSSKGIAESVPIPNSKIFEKKYQKQKIKLGNGIEITVPINILKNKDFIEFKNNDDGSTSVIVKNVSNS